MRRRIFLNILGKGILGVAIALKVPDILMPRIRVNKELWPDIINDIYFTPHPGQIEFMKRFKAASCGPTSDNY